MADWRAAGALAVLALLSLAPAEASAQTYDDRSANESVRDRRHPEYEALGVPFGAFIIHPTLETGVESNDNFFANDHNIGAQDETSYTLRGAADIESQWAANLLKLSFGAQRALHDNFPKDDATTGHARADLRLDVTRDTILGGGADYEKLIEERSEPDAQISTVHPVEYTYSEAFLYGGHTFNRVRVSARASHRDYNYDNGYTITGAIVPEDYRDHTEDIGTARVEYLVSPRTALLVEGSWNNRDYDAFARGSNGQTYTAGANFELARLVDGEVKVGYLRQEYDSPAIGVIDGLAVNANVNWVPTQLTSVSFSADRQVEDSGSTANASYLLTRAGVSVDHEIFRNVVLSLGMSGGKRDYNGVDRKDDFVSTDLTATYLLNRNVSVRGGFASDRVSSAGVDRNRNFEINRAFVSLAFKL